MGRPAGRPRIAWALRRKLARAALLVLVLYGSWRFATWPASRFATRFQQDELHVVALVIDGDTLELANGDRVRLLGIDTPEFSGRGPEPFAIEATDRLRELTQGRKIRLQFDRERFDKYGRVLGWVWVEDTLVNEVLAREGLGVVMTRFPYSSRMKSRLLNAQQQARAERRGRWQPATRNQTSQ